MSRSFRRGGPLLARLAAFLTTPAASALDGGDVAGHPALRCLTGVCRQLPAFEGATAEGIVRF